VKWSNEILKSKDLLKSSFKKGEENIIKIGYFSGTISHNKDFAVVIEPLKKILSKHKHVKLVLAGPLDVEDKFIKEFKDQIIQLPFVSRKKHFETIAKVDINISPLEVGNPFCEAKSEIKWSGAGILKIPTVASATQPFLGAIEDGRDGFIANSTEEWFDKLNRLIADENLRNQIGGQARKKILEKYTTVNAKNDNYYSYLKDKLN
jgi:glycosyltransferase involved in cell wall biosynthesis